MSAFRSAAELDRYLAAEAAFNAAKAEGKTDDEAVAVAKEAAAEKYREQVLRSVGAA
jgi:hypothetical protein